MKYSLKIAPQVSRDLDEIELFMVGWGSYLSSIDRFLEHVYNRIEALKYYPFMGEKLSGKTMIPTEIRYLIVDEYLVFYEVSEGSIDVYRVLSQRQDYVQILKLK